MTILNQKDLIEALVNGDVMTFDVEECIVELMYNGECFLKITSNGSETRWNSEEIYEVYKDLEEEQVELYS